MLLSYLFIIFYQTWPICIKFSAHALNKFAQSNLNIFHLKIFTLLFGCSDVTKFDSISGSHIVGQVYMCNRIA